MFCTAALNHTKPFKNNLNSRYTKPKLKRNRNGNQNYQCHRRFHGDNAAWRLISSLSLLGLFSLVEHTLIGFSWLVIQVSALSPLITVQNSLCSLLLYISSVFFDWTLRKQRPFPGFIQFPLPFWFSGRRISYPLWWALFIFCIN